MADAGFAPAPRQPVRRTAVTTEPGWFRLLLVAGTLAVLALLVLAPLAAVFTEALGEGVGAAIASLGDPDAQAAIRLTLITAAIAVPLNAVFGSPPPGRSPSSTSGARRS